MELNEDLKENEILRVQEHFLTNEVLKLEEINKGNKQVN